MHTIKKLKRTIVFILKLALFASLFGIFFGIFGINNPWLFNLSRTTGVTMVTFVVLGIALMSVYGGYAIGTQKSRPIVHSMALATIITDLVTHLQLSIMNTSEKNNASFVYETPERLLLVILLQLVVIVFFAYFGNYIYFSLAPPDVAHSLSPQINRRKRQHHKQVGILPERPPHAALQQFFHHAGEPACAAVIPGGLQDQAGGPQPEQQSGSSAQRQKNQGHPDDSLFRFRLQSPPPFSARKTGHMPKNGPGGPFSVYFLMYARPTAPGPVWVPTMLPMEDTYTFRFFSRSPRKSSRALQVSEHLAWPMVTQ